MSDTLQQGIAQGGFTPGEDNGAFLTSIDLFFSQSRNESIQELGK